MAIDAETERVMRNWAMWRAGSLTGVPVSGAYDLEAPGHRGDTAIPLINGEAVEVEQAVQAIDEQLRTVLEEYWLKSGPIEMKARRCACCVATLYRRLDRAHAAIKAHRAELRKSAERKRQAYARSHS